jgi:signal transduction histidine kinase
MHDSRLEISSEKGKGSCFYFEMKAAAPEEKNELRR